MKPLIFTYSESNEVKVLVATREKKQLKIERLIRTEREIPVEENVEEQDFSGTGLDNLNDDLDLGEVDDAAESPQEEDTGEDIEKLNAELSNYKLKKSEFVAVATEPSLNYHIYSGSKIKNTKNLKQYLIEDITNNKNIEISGDQLDYVDLYEDSMLAVFLADDVPAVNLVNAIAAQNKKRFYKLNSIKSGEIALANYVSQNYKFLQEDLTLILHVGKEQSNIIFLEGNTLKYIGDALEIGSGNLSTYDIYFSKILLEMENGNIPRLDNILLCGEYNSENLVLSFYGSFPEANIIEMDFSTVNTESLTGKQKESLKEYSVLIAAAYEYMDELNGDYEGIRILPDYIRENQKSFQMAWHGYLMMPLIFGVTFFLTVNILNNRTEIAKLDKEVQHLSRLQEKNKELLTDISQLEKRIENFDQTMSILNKASSKPQKYSSVLEDISGFVAPKRNFWLTQLQDAKGDKGKLQLNGYSLSRSVLTEFADKNNYSMLNNIIYEPLREYRAYEFSLLLNISSNNEKENDSQ